MWRSAMTCVAPISDLSEEARFPHKGNRKLGSSTPSLQVGPRPGPSLSISAAEGAVKRVVKRGCVKTAILTTPLLALILTTPSVAQSKIISTSDPWAHTTSGRAEMGVGQPPRSTGAQEAFWPEQLPALALAPAAGLARQAGDAAQHKR